MIDRSIYDFLVAMSEALMDLTEALDPDSSEDSPDPGVHFSVNKAALDSGDIVIVDKGEVVTKWEKP